MPNYKLHYFGVSARGELIRLLFAVSGIDFEDVRINLEEWSALKEKTPLGQLPYLEVDDTKLVCSIPCARYVAAEGNLLGRNHLERAQADGIVDLCADIVTEYYEVILLRTPDDKKPEAFKAFYSSFLVKIANNLEKLIGCYGSGEHSVGDKQSWADIAIFRIYKDKIFDGIPHFKTKYPKITAVAEKVSSNVRIQNYLKHRQPMPI